MNRIYLRAGLVFRVRWPLLYSYPLTQTILSLLNVCSDVIQCSIFLEFLKQDFLCCEQLPCVTIYKLNAL